MESFGSSVAVDCTDLGVASFNVVVTAIDGAGNAYVSNNIPITVNDATAPVISSVSSGLTEVLSSAGAATIDATTYITASDNCTAAGSADLRDFGNQSDGSGFAATFAADCDDVGAKTFYFRVTDATVRHVSSEQAPTTITIADNTEPDR